MISSMYLLPAKVFLFYLVQNLNTLDSRHLMMPACPRELRQARASAAKKVEESRDSHSMILFRLDQAEIGGPTSLTLKPFWP